MNRHRVALLAISLTLSGCATAPAPTPSPPADPPDAPRLLVRLNLGVGGWPGFPGQHVADYLTDGTVIRVQGGTLEVNRLTETGLATVRTTLAAAAGLLASPLRIEARETVIPVDSTNPMPGLLSEPVNTFVLERPDGSRYAVIAPSRPRVASDPSPDPIVEGLTALGSALADPATLVASDGLAGPWETYQPATMAVFLTLEVIDPVAITDGVIPRVGPTDWPFTGTPATFGTVFKGPGTHVTRRCALLPSAEASTAIASLAKFGGRFSGDGPASQIGAGFTWGGDVLLWVDGSQATSVYLQAQALMPEDDAVSCIDALSY